MKKNLFKQLICALSFISFMLLSSACDSTDSKEESNAITIGLNFEITGTLPDVGEQAHNAAEMFVSEMNVSGGVQIGGKTYRVETLLKDNGATEEGAVAANQNLIEGEQVLAIVGPNTSFLAISAGGAANDLKTVMITPWSTNEQATLDRPYVFRASYLTSFQGKILANFAKNQYEGTSAGFLYAEDSPFPKKVTESFLKEWANLNGSVAAKETFMTGDENLSLQLNNIKNAGCDFLFLPQYPNEVPGIVEQAHEAGVDAQILGAGSWASKDLLVECGADCEGYFFNKQFVADGATGAAKKFVDTYTKKYGEVPGDVAALTWDSLFLIVEAIKNCGTLTGDLAVDRDCIREGMASIQGFEGITGSFTFDENGDPQKCLFIVQILDGEFTYYDTVCPE